MDDLPEGLHLTSGRFEDTRIDDAQDLTWVTFSTGGTGDLTALRRFHHPPARRLDRVTR